MRELVDLHTHTYLSGHGEGTVDDVIQAALARGLKTIALTEHMYLPPQYDAEHNFSMSPEEELIYKEQIEEAQKKYPQIDIVHGIEIDYYDGFENYVEDHDTGATFKLGSVHLINGWEFDNPNRIEEWHKYGVDWAWKSYFELWEQAIQSSVGFDTMPHPDLVKKFGHRPSFDLKTFYEDLFERIPNRDVALEVSTAGLRKPVGEIYPDMVLLKAAFNAGFPITVASDSHKPSEVGYKLEQAYDYAYEAGYREIRVPRPDGDFRTVKL